MPPKAISDCPQASVVEEKSRQTALCKDAYDELKVRTTPVTQFAQHPSCELPPLEIHDPDAIKLSNTLDAPITRATASRQLKPEIAVNKLPGFSILDGAHKLVPGKSTNVQIDVDGKPRELLLHLPKGYDGKKKMPLVLMCNGITDTPSGFEQYTQMSKLADKKGFVVAYMAGEGRLGPANDGTFNNGQFPWDADQPNDVQFTKSTIQGLSKDLMVDKQRVYLAGFSQGGSTVELFGEQASEGHDSCGWRWRSMAG